MTPRQLRLLQGETKLRTHLPDDVALTTHLVYRHETGQWCVIVKLYPERGSMLELGVEPLEEFPSDTMIAQAVLVA